MSHWIRLYNMSANRGTMKKEEEVDFGGGGVAVSVNGQGVRAELPMYHDKKKQEIPFTTGVEEQYKKTEKQDRDHKDIKLGAGIGGGAGAATGAGVGAAAGAGIGAAVGSIVPGAGTAIGALVGAGVGAGIGFVSGGAAIGGAGAGGGALIAWLLRKKKK